MFDSIWKPLLVLSPWIAALAFGILADRAATKRAKRNDTTYQLSINWEKTDE